MRESCRVHICLMTPRTLVLILAVLDCHGVPVRDRNTRRQTILLSDNQWTSHMCKAQCEAFCGDNRASCGRYCRSGVSTSWVLTCSENVEEEIKGEEKSEIMRKSQCPGTCSVLQGIRRDPDKEAYIPPKPVPVLVRDLVKQSVTISWTTPVTSHTVIYVVQESEDSDYENWSSAHLVPGDHYELLNVTDLCSRRKYRVAAVSSYGSYWFGDEVVMPDLAPPSPERFNYTRLVYNEATREFDCTLEWHSPIAWTVPDLKFSLFHRWNCPPTLDQKILFEDEQVLSNFGNKMEVRIPEYAAGCKLDYGVKAASRCREDLSSNISWIIIDLRCEALESLYTGQYCTPPPFDPPGRVEIVDVRVVPGMGGSRLHVTWSPPTDLGSSGRVGYYTVFYGTFTSQFAGFQSHRNITVPADTLQTDIPFPPEYTGQRAGVLVMAGATGQVIENPIGLIRDVSSETFTGEVLLEVDGMVVYHEPGTRTASVYWYPPPPPTSPAPADRRVAVQWGMVDRRHVHVESDDGDGQGVEAAASDKEGKGPGYKTKGKDNVDLDVLNTTVVHQALEGASRD